MKRTGRLLRFAALSGLVACAGDPSGPGAPAPPVGDDVLAAYDGGAVTVEQAGKALLALPPDRRPEPAEIDDDWYAELVRELALDAILRREVELAGIREDPEMQAALAEVRREVTTQFFFEEAAGGITPPTEAEVRTTYENDLESYSREARREVFHIFLRRTPAAGSRELRERALEIRRRALAGESFSRLAAELSESETRHQDGRMGFFDESELPEELARVVFALEVGVASEPLLTEDGVHLFQVGAAIDETTFQFEDVRNAVVQRIVAERREAAVEEAMADVPELDAGAFVARADELEALLRGGDPRTLVLRVDDYEVTAGRLLEALAQRRGGAAAQPDAIEQMLTDFVRRERVYRHVLAEIGAEQPELARRLSVSEDLAILTRYRQRQVELKLDREVEQRLRPYYLDHEKRFSEPLRLQIRRLSVPRDSQSASTVMADLEAAREALDAGTLTLEGLAARLGGSISDLGWVAYADLAARLPEVAPRVTDLDAGRHSPPFSTADALGLLAVVDRTEPVARPFESAVDDVRRAYLADHGSEVYREWRQEVFRKAGVRLFEERIPALREAAFPAAPGDA